MFTIYSRIVGDLGNRSLNRYFHDWEKAKEALLDDMQNMYGSCPVIREYDYFNSDKGFYVYEKVLDLNGKEVHLSLLDGYFEDD